jgi:hypothetical protein
MRRSVVRHQFESLQQRCAYNPWQDNRETVDRWRCNLALDEPGVVGGDDADVSLKPRKSRIVGIPFWNQDIGIDRSILDVLIRSVSICVAGKIPSSVGCPLAWRRGVWRQEQLRVVDDVAGIFVVADDVHNSGEARALAHRRAPGESLSGRPAIPATSDSWASPPGDPRRPQ